MTRIGLLSAFTNALPRVVPYSKSQHVQACKVGGCEIGVLVSGIGRKKAARATERLCTEFKPDHLVVLGVCGGVHPELNIGTLLVADRVHYQGESASLGGQEMDAVRKCLADSSIDHRVGGMQTFDRTVLSQKDVVGDVLGVDMEAYAIAKTAREYGTPLIIIKSVSDLVPETKPLMIPSIRLMVRVIRHFRTAKSGLNAFARSYFTAQRP